MQRPITGGRIVITRTCLSAETLCDYAEGRLADHRRRRIEDHLSRCDSCLDTVAAARLIAERGPVLNAEVVPAGVTRRAVQSIRHANRSRWTDHIAGVIRAWIIGWPARWRFMSGETLLAVRGRNTLVGDDFFRVRKSCRGLKLEIDIEKTAQRSARVSVTLVTSAHPAGSARVSLYRNDPERETASCLLEDAPVVFENVPFGHYRLVFTRNGSTIGHYRFFLRESVHEHA